MHPVWEAHHLSRGTILFPLGFELFFHFLGKYFDDTMSRYRIVLIEYHLLLVLIRGDYFQIIWSELISVDFLYAVDEFYRCRVSIFGEKWDGGLSSFNSLEDITDRFINKKGILYFVLLFFCWLFVKSFCYLCVVGGIVSACLLFFIAFILLAFTLLVLLVITADLRNGHGFINGRLLIFGFFWVSKRKIVVIEFWFDIKLVKLIIHGIIRLFDYYDSLWVYQIGKDFLNFSCGSLATFWFSWALWTELNRKVTSILSVLSASLSFFMTYNKL